MSIYHQILGVPAPPKPATERLFELLWKIQEEYKGIITTEDKSAIDAIILYRIEQIKKEEKEYALNNGL